jgi:hypothetical protein
LNLGDREYFLAAQRPVPQQGVRRLHFSAKAYFAAPKIGGPDPMRKKMSAGPCRTLSAEQRAEVERQMRDEGRLRSANEAELEKLRRRKTLLQEGAAQHGAHE